MRRRRGDGGGDRFIFCRSRKVRRPELKALFLFLVRRFGTCYCAARRRDSLQRPPSSARVNKSTGGVPSILSATAHIYTLVALNVKREGGVKRTEQSKPACLLSFEYFLCRTAANTSLIKFLSPPAPLISSARTVNWFLWCMHTKAGVVCLTRAIICGPLCLIKSSTQFAAA